MLQQSIVKYPRMCNIQNKRGRFVNFTALETGDQKVTCGSGLPAESKDGTKRHMAKDKKDHVCRSTLSPFLIKPLGVIYVGSLWCPSNPNRIPEASLTPHHCPQFEYLIADIKDGTSAWDLEGALSWLPRGLLVPIRSVPQLLRLYLMNDQRGWGMETDYWLYSYDKVSSAQSR